jgi:hypothetical protein
MKRKLAVLTCLAALAVPALAQSRVEPPAVVDGVVKIRDSFPAFHGRVVAENGSCNGPRPVKLYERKRNGSRELLGRTMADLDGKWAVIVDPLASGAYFATAPEYDRIDGNVAFVCERAKSRTLTVD